MTSYFSKQPTNLSFWFIRLIFKFFRIFSLFGLKQGGWLALAFGSKSKNRLGRFLNLMPTEPKNEVTKKGS